MNDTTFCTDAEFIKELRAVGCIYAAHVTNPENATDEKLVALWRKPFDNNLSGRLPTKPTVHIELHDEKASAGAVLCWDFVELEAAWPAE